MELKRNVALLLCFTLILPLILSACADERELPAVEETSTTSYSEMMSYYDQLARGDYEATPATTSTNRNVTIEGDVNSLPKDVLEKLNNEINLNYNSVISFLGGSYGATTTIILDYNYSGSEPNYIAGSTIIVDANRLAENPDEIDSIIYGFAGVAQNYPRDDCPEWIVTSIRYYTREVFEIYPDSSSWKLPSKYQGGSYTDGKEVGAAFLKWIEESKRIDIVSLLNREMKKTTEFSAQFWQEVSGRTLEQLWTEYKAA